MVRRSLFSLLVAALAAFLSGCGLLVGAVATDFNLSLEPESLTAARGSEHQVTLKVSRVLPIDVAPFPLQATLYNPPDGVSLEEGEVQIPSGINERVLPLVVAEDAALGEHRVTVEVTSGVRTKQVVLELTVTP